MKAHKCSTLSPSVMPVPTLQCSTCCLQAGHHLSKAVSLTLMFSEPSRPASQPAAHANFEGSSSLNDWSSCISLDAQSQMKGLAASVKPIDNSVLTLTRAPMVCRHEGTCAAACQAPMAKPGVSSSISGSSATALHNVKTHWQPNDSCAKLLDHPCRNCRQLHHNQSRLMH